MPPRKLTTRLLATLQPGDRVRDTEARGLFVEVGAKGQRVLKFQADVRLGVHSGSARPVSTFRKTLGRYPEQIATLEEARKIALALRAEVRAGRDPRGELEERKTWTVARMRDEYLRDLKIRDRSALTIRDFEEAFSRYLVDWLELPITEITRAMCRERHAALTATRGKRTANKALRAFGTAYSFAWRVQDESIGENPVKAVTMHKPGERSATAIPPTEIADWFSRLSKLTNPSRRIMHELGVFSGLRPGNLVTLERSWFQPDDNAIVIPAEHMKGRREFSLPLSSHMKSLVERALSLSTELAAGSPWLFPTRSRDGSEVIATQVWRERDLPTGHALRHTYSNACRLAGVDDTDRELLLAHKLPGVRGVYLHSPALFERLREAQESVTAWLLGATGRG